MASAKLSMYRRSSLCAALLACVLVLSPVTSVASLQDEVLLLPNGPREKLCAACTQAVEQLELVLSDPSLVNQSVAIIESSVCEQLPPGQKEQCDAAVQEYVPVVFAELQAEITVENICIKASRLCPPETRALEGAKGVKGPEECYACRLVIKLLKKHLSNPKTQAKIKTYLDTRCSIITNATMAAECADAVDKFLPVVFANLDVILNDKKLCKEASLCALATT